MIIKNIKKEIIINVLYNNKEYYRFDKNGKIVWELYITDSDIGKYGYFEVSLDEQTNLEKCFVMGQREEKIKNILDNRY